MRRSQCFLTATRPSERKVPVTLPFAFLTAALSLYEEVSGRQRRKMMMRTGGHAPNQYRGRQPWDVVSTRPRAKAAASR